MCFNYGGRSQSFNYWVIIKITKTYVYFGITSESVRQFSPRYKWSKLPNNEDTITMFEIYTNAFSD